MREKWRGIGAIIGCMCVHTTIGSFYFWGCINVYVCSYLYYEGGDKTVTTRHLLMFLPIRGIIQFFSFPFGAYLDKKYGPKSVLAFAALTFMASFTPFIWIKSMYGYIALLGIGFGLPEAGYIPPLSVAWRHFPEKKGLLSGIILCAYGSGSFFLNLLAQYIVNPNDEKPEYPPEGDINDGQKYFSKNVYKNVPKMWVVIVCIWGVLLTLGLILVQNPKKKNDLQHINEGPTEELIRLNGSSNLNNQITEESITSSPEDSYDPYSVPSLKTGLKSLQFWMLMIMLTCALIVTFTFSFCYKSLGLHFDYNDHFLNLVGTLYVLLLGSARIPFGYLFHKVPYKLLMTGIICSMIFCTASLSYLGSDSKAIFAILVLFCVVFIAGNFPIYPAMTVKIFGMKYGSQIYGFMSGAFASAAILTFFGNFYLQPVMGYGGYMCIPAALNALALLILWTIFPLKPVWSNSAT